MGLMGKIGVFIGSITFVIYYVYAYLHYPNPGISQEIGALSYVPLMISLSLLSFEIYRINKQLIFGVNGIFWAGVGMAYLFSDIFHLIPSKVFIITILGLWVILSLLVYLFQHK